MKSRLYEEEPVYCVTTDVDWASEDAIAYQQRIFDDFDVTATYFVTHASALTESLRREGKIEVGVHPNFLPGSSHGDSFDEVVRTVLSFAPGARCFRSHRYYDASPATETLVEAGILYDSNLMTNLQQGIQPIAHESGLVRFPCFYEDGTHNKWRREWDYARHMDDFRRPGIKVLSVHPLVTAFNCTSSGRWAELKSMFTSEQWASLTIDVISSHASDESGPERFVVDMLTDIRSRGAAVMTMEELYTQFAPDGGRDDA
jgi:Polysaccharide deacetylase